MQGEIFMKYTIMGFSQEKLVKLGLDTIDAAILRYFIDFKEGMGMKSKVIEGGVYYWLQYDGVIKELPILNMKKCTIQSRLFKLRDAGVLTHRVVREGGTYSYYGIGDRYEELITSHVRMNSESSNEESCRRSSENKDGQGVNKNTLGVDESMKIVDENSQGVDENPQVAYENLQGYQSKLTTNNPSIKDPSTKKDINTLSLKEQVEEIIDYLNLNTGKNFRSSTKETCRLISARFSEGFKVEDFKGVIDNMKFKWSGTKFQQYLVPTTLFGSKFETYLNQGKEVEKMEHKRGNVASSDEGSRKELEEKLSKIVLKEDM